MTGGDDLRKQTDEDREQALRVERERLAKQRAQLGDVVADAAGAKGAEMRQIFANLRRVHARDGRELIRRARLLGRGHISQ